MKPEDEKRERVIHTRVEPSLHAKLKRQAKEKGRSVSNYVWQALAEHMKSKERQGE